LAAATSRDLVSPQAAYGVSSAYTTNAFTARTASTDAKNS